MRTRCALLALFWLGWLGMLAGAVLIILQAPRCRPPPAVNWWNKGPLYQIGDVQAFADNLPGNASSVVDLCNILIFIHQAVPIIHLVFYRYTALPNTSEVLYLCSSACPIHLVFYIYTAVPNTASILCTAVPNTASILCTAVPNSTSSIPCFYIYLCENLLIQTDGCWVIVVL